MGTKSIASYLKAENSDNVLEYSAHAEVQLKSALETQDVIIGKASDAKRLVMYRAWELDLQAHETDRIQKERKTEGWTNIGRNQKDLALYYGVSPGTVDEGRRIFEAVRKHGCKFSDENWAVLLRNIRRKQITAILGKDAYDGSNADLYDKAAEIDGVKDVRAARPDDGSKSGQKSDDGQKQEIPTPQELAQELTGDREALDFLSEIVGVIVSASWTADDAPTLAGLAQQLAELARELAPADETAHAA